MKRGEAKVVVTADISTAIKQIERVNQQLKNLVKQSNKTNTELKKLGKSSGLTTLDRDLVKTRKTMQSLNSVADNFSKIKFKNPFLDMRAGAERTTASAKELSKELKIINKNKTKDIMNDTRTGINKSSTVLEEFVSKLKSTSKIKLSDPMNKVTSGAKKAESATKEVNREIKTVSSRKVPNPFGKLAAGARAATRAINLNGASLLAVQSIFSDTNRLITGTVDSYRELESTVNEMTYQFSTVEDQSKAVSYSIKDLREEMASGSEKGKVLTEMMSELNLYAGLTAFSVQDSASGMLELAKAGYSAENALGVIKPAMIAADMNGQDLQQTIHDVSGSMLSFGIDLRKIDNPSKEFNKRLSQMQLAADLTQSDLADLTYGMQYMAPIASNVGLSFEEAVVMVSALGDAGLEGSRGARVMASGLLNMANPTEKAASSMDELGVSFYDSEGKARPLLDIFKDLQNGTKDLTEEQRALHMENIFGKTAIKSWGSVLNQSVDVLEKNMEAVNGAGEGMGYLYEKFLMVKSGLPKDEIDDFEKTMASLTDETEKAAYKAEFLEKALENMVNERPHNYLELMEEQVVSFGAMVGQVVTGDLARFIYTLSGPATEGFNAFTEAITGSSDGSYVFATEMAAAGLETAFLVSGIAILIHTIGILAGAFVLGAVIYAFVEALKESGLTAEGLGKILGNLADGAMKTLGFVMDNVLIPIFGTLIDTFKEVYKELEPFIDEALPQLQSLVNHEVVPAVQDFIKYLGELAVKIVPLAFDVFTDLLGLFIILVGILKPIVGFVVDLATNFPEVTRVVVITTGVVWAFYKAVKTWETLTATFKVIKGGIEGIGTVFGNTASGIGRSAGTLASTLGNKAGTSHKALGVMTAGFSGALVAGVAVAVGAVTWLYGEYRRQQELTTLSSRKRIEQGQREVLEYLDGTKTISELTGDQLKYLEEEYELTQKNVAAILYTMNGETQTLADGTKIGAEQAQTELEWLGVHWNLSVESMKANVDAYNTYGETLDTGIATGVGEAIIKLDSLDGKFMETEGSVKDTIDQLNSITSEADAGIFAADEKSQRILKKLSNTYGLSKDDIAIAVGLINGTTARMADGTVASEEDIANTMTNIADEYRIGEGEVARIMVGINRHQKKMGQGSMESEEEIKKSNSKINKDTETMARRMSKILTGNEDKWEIYASIVQAQGPKVGDATTDMSGDTKDMTKEMEGYLKNNGDYWIDYGDIISAVASNSQSELNKVLSNTAQAQSAYSQMQSANPQSGLINPATFGITPYGGTSGYGPRLVGATGHYGGSSINYEGSTTNTNSNNTYVYLQGRSARERMNEVMMRRR